MHYYISMFICVIPANTKHLNNISTTSAQRLRRWSNVPQMLYKCFVSQLNSSALVTVWRAVIEKGVIIKYYVLLILTHAL